MQKIIFLIIALLCLPLGGRTWAQSGVEYIECSWTGSSTNGHVVKTTKYCTDYQRLNGQAGLGDGWYYADYSDTYKGNRWQVTGNAKLIIKDGVTLTCKKGIQIHQNCTLTIYVQSGATGTLRCEGSDGENGAIGGNNRSVGGHLVIHGGTIYAKPGSNNAAAIGGGEGDSDHATGMQSVTIWDGTVEAYGKGSGAGIGCGEKNNTPPAITIYGGNITAKCIDTYAAGIGGSEDCSNGTIKIYGGTITASSRFDGGSGIGSGYQASMNNPIYIYGGTINAKGSFGAGIGSGWYADQNANIYIYGGTITAQGGEGAAGIGGGDEGSQNGTIYIYGGTITATAGVEAAGIGGGNEGNGGTVIINGGEVYAYGKSNTYAAAGIGGGGYSGNGGTVIVNGGYVEAVGGPNYNNVYSAPGIGGGNSGDGGTFIINGGKVKATGSYWASPIGIAHSPGAMPNITIASDMMVYSSLHGKKVDADDRVAACEEKENLESYYVTIEACDHEGATYTQKNGSYHTVVSCLHCSETNYNERHTYETLPSGGMGACTKCQFELGVPKTLTFYQANAAGTGYDSGTSYTVSSGDLFFLPACTSIPGRMSFVGWAEGTPADNENLIWDGSEQLFNADHSFTVTTDKSYKARYKVVWSGEGSGTESDPYIIATEDDLDNMASIVDENNDFSGKFFRMDSDLDFTGRKIYELMDNTFEVIGNNEKPFRGTFDGNGHTISGITLDNAYELQGIFAFVEEEGTVKNLTLTGSTIYGSSYTGGIAGQCSGTIENCHVTNSVTIQSGSNNDTQAFGGIAGFNSGTISGCTSAATVSGNARVGGIAGSNTEQIRNCLYLGYSVTGTSFCGAIAGINYSVATLTSNSYVPWTDCPKAIVDNNGDSQDVSGAQASYTVTSGTTGLTLDFGEATTAYEYNGIIVYSFGLSYVGTLYSGNGQSVTFTPESDKKISAVAASSGTLTGPCDGLYTLTMPSANITITATLSNYDVTLYDSLTPGPSPIGEGSIYSLDQTNTATIEANDGHIADVTLSGRTLWKDGAWNTLCLPFDVTASQIAISDHPFYGATIMELDVENKWSMVNNQWSIDNESGAYQTGFDGETLYLFFMDADDIEAGKPYIIKWDNTEGTERTEYTENPVFRGVEIEGTAPETIVGTSPGAPLPPKGGGAGGGAVSFIGCYDPVGLTVDDKSNLFLGVDDQNRSTLYYPSAANKGDGKYYVNAFRGYFHVEASDGVRAFSLHFGEEEETGINSLTPGPSPIGEGSIYSLDGRKVNGQSSMVRSALPLGSSKNGRLPKGVYIKNGRKVVIK